MKITNSNTLFQRPNQKSPPRAKGRKQWGSQTCFETCHTHDGSEWMIKGGSQDLQVQSHNNVHSLIQHLLSNEAKWNIQINEDIGIIKIKSCGSYAFLNNEHCGYWRGRTGFFLLIWHTSQISFKQNLSLQNAVHGLIDRSPSIQCVLIWEKNIFPS